MIKNRVLPETLLQLILDILSKSEDFKYIEGIQPFLISFENKKYYIYVKNLSSAYFKDRPDTTRAQLPIKDDFSKIKDSNIPFIFLGYDKINDVLVCWNFHTAKKRLNERKSVSFYSRTFYQEEVVLGEFLRKELKNDDIPVLFKRKDLIQFFKQIDTFFPEDNTLDKHNTHVESEKITQISDINLLNQLKPLLATDTPHTLEAIKLVQNFYGDLPNMKFRDWANLIKNLAFKNESF